MAQEGSRPEEDGPVNINYGCTNTHIYLGFTRATNHILLTTEQADAMIAALQQTKVDFAAHQAKLAAKQN